MKGNRSVQDVGYLCTKLGGNIRQMHNSSLLSISSGYQLQCYQLEDTTFSDFGHSQRKASWETFLLGNYKILIVSMNFSSLQVKSHMV